MKKLYAATILFLTCVSFTAIAQIPYWQWAQSASGPSINYDYDYGDGITQDARGYIYITGGYDSIIKFGNTSLVGGGVFIVKLDTAGTVIWARSSTNFGTGTAITTDAVGNVYVTGAYDSTISFDNYTLTNPGTGLYENVFFIVKYDSSGDVMWAKGANDVQGNNAEGTNNNFGTGISTDAVGNVYATGTFSSYSIAFDNYTITQSGNSDQFYSDGVGNIFIVKYDVQGNVTWAQSAAVTSNISFGIETASAIAKAISTDRGGNVFVTGEFSDTVTFGSALTALGNGFFIVKYDSIGNAIWMKSAGGKTSDVVTAIGNSVSTDVNGNIYVTGVFDNPTIILGNDTLTNSGVNTGDIFIVKYNASGNVIWVKSAGGSANDVSTAIRTDIEGNIYVSGDFESSSILFGSTTLVNASNNSQNIFVVKYDSSGNVIWAKSGGGNGSSGGNAISIDDNGNAYVIGTFSDTVAFGSFVLPNADDYNVFVAKIGICYLPPPPINVTTLSAQMVCFGNSTILNATDTGVLSWYSAPLGGTLLQTGDSFVSSALTYTSTFYVQDSTCGASIRTPITVTVNPPLNAYVTQLGADTLTTGTYNTYQWLVNSTAINGAVNQIYIAGTNGNYQVAVTDSNGCVDTSVVYALTTLGVTALNDDGDIHTYPNPTAGVIYFNGVKNGFRIEVYDALGEIISSSIIDQDNYNVNLSGKAAGMYFYRIAVASNLIQQGKIVLE